MGYQPKLPQLVSAENEFLARLREVTRSASLRRLEDAQSPFHLPLEGDLTPQLCLLPPPAFACWRKSAETFIKQALGTWDIRSVSRSDRATNAERISYTELCFEAH